MSGDSPDVLKDIKGYQDERPPNDEVRPLPNKAGNSASGPPPGEDQLLLASSNIDTYFTERVPIPFDDNYSFSWRKLWAFTGPGFLMSIAYLDPGNIESDLQTGAIAGTRLLWVTFWATVMGLLLQRLSARLGVVTGFHLAELCQRYFPPLPRYTLWIMVEIAIIGSDIQEVIGTATAFLLLFKLKLWIGVLITLFDTFTFLFLDKYGLRKLEVFFGFLITVMAVTFGYEYVTNPPNQLSVLKGLVLPMCAACPWAAFKQAVGMVGAIIMPHNLYLHSALVKSRDINRSHKPSVKDANRYVFIESTIALGVSLAINLFVVCVFASFDENTTLQIYEHCNKTAPEFAHDFDPGVNGTNVVGPGDMNIRLAGSYLACMFGKAPMIIWAVGILAAGQSSTMTGTYAGQFVMEGFLDLRWSRWKRVLLTRSLAILPTLLIVIYQSPDQLSSLNDDMNVLMSLMLPFALLPTLILTSSKRIMGEFTNSVFHIALASLISVLIISINLYFVYDSILRFFSQGWLVNLLIALFLIFYLGFVLYLVFCFLVVLGVNSLTRIPFLGQYLGEKYTMQINSNSSMSINTSSELSLRERIKNCWPCCQSS